MKNTSVYGKLLCIAIKIPFYYVTNITNFWWLNGSAIETKYCCM